MNSVVEKLAAIEKEVVAIQPKMAPLTERIADLHQKVTDFTKQLADLANESVAVKQDVELTRKSLGRIQELISESKVESEQLVAGQEENLQRCETMTAVFGAAFQAVSQFFEAAQQMGLADQAKAVFLAPPSAPVMIGDNRQQPAENRIIQAVPMPEPVTETPPQPLLPESPAPLPPVMEPIPPVLAEPIPDVPPSSIMETSTAEIEERPAVPAQETPTADEPIVSSVAEPSHTQLPPVREPMTEPVDEPVVPPSLTETAMTETVEKPNAQETPTADEPPPPESVSPVAETTPSEAESALSGSDFDSVTESGEPVSWSVPGLPDVAALPEMTYYSDSHTGTDPEQLDAEGSDAEDSDEMASHLDVPPLNLAVPASPAPHEAAEMNEAEEQEIENMLAAMTTPVTAAVGS